MSYKKYQIVPFRQGATKNGVLMQKAVCVFLFLLIVSFRQTANLFLGFFTVYRLLIPLEK